MTASSKRILCLNLAILMLLSLMPIGAAASYKYAYHSNRVFDGTDSVSNSYYLSLSYSDTITDGWIQYGWSLTENGAPVASEADVPSPGSEVVHLYACWARAIEMTAPDGGKYTVPVGQFQIGDTFVSYEDLKNPSTAKMGTGWSFTDGILTLDSSYTGAPISAHGGLILNVNGEVSVRATDSSALRANRMVYFKAQENASSCLTISGNGTNPAVQTENQSCVAEHPFKMRIQGLSALAMDVFSFTYSLPSTDYADNVFTGTFETITSGYNLAVYRGKVIRPTSNSIELTPEDPAEKQITLKLDPNGGELDGAAAVKTYTKTLPELTRVSFEELEFTDIPAPAPAREGYVFLGWTGGEYNDSYLYAGETPVVSAEETTLRAVWQEMPGNEYVWLDGNGFDLTNGHPRYAYALENGKLTLPDEYAANSTFVGWSEEETDTVDLISDPVLDNYMLPGESVSLTPGSILYAVYADGPICIVDGNGHTSASGSSKLAVVSRSYSWASTYKLVTYNHQLQQGEYFELNGQAVLDFNTAADGSGESSSYAETRNSYVQWADAPSGSIVLYSDGYSTADGRYGKVISPEAAASFDFESAYGFTRAGYKFDGWMLPGGENVLNALPDADQNGLILLQAKWLPYTMNYVTSVGNAVETSRANTSGTLTVHFPVGYQTEFGKRVLNGKVFNGWNTKEDGSGTWYLPDAKLVPTEDMTVYEQCISVAADEAAVLLEDATGTKYFNKRSGTPVEGKEDILSVTMPAAADEWVYANKTDEWSYEYFGFLGGETYEIPGGSTLCIRDSDFYGVFLHGNGGTFAYGSNFRFFSAGTQSTPTNLSVYVQQSDFETVPEGATLGGWASDPEVGDATDVYPLTTTVGQLCSAGDDFYALWDGENTVYMKFVDENSESFTRRYTAGETITLPMPELWLGYKFTGWSDGTNTYAGGSSYTVPADDTTLTAQWSRRTKLMVDGVEYDTSGTYDYSNGETQGWKYQNGSLYLYNYNGGAIFAPEYLSIYLHGSNTITAPAGEVALSDANSLNLQDNYQLTGDGGLRVIGSAGMPAVHASNLSANGKGPYSFTGGVGAPAAHLGYSCSLYSRHVTMQGGAGAAALVFDSEYSSLSTNTGVRLFAGENAASALELTDTSAYQAQPYLRTEPVYVTVTLDGNGGTVNGRSVWTVTKEYGESFSLRDFTLLRENAAFLNWTDEAGEAYTSSIYTEQNVTLKAQWNIIPYEHYLILDCLSYGLMDGEQYAYVELPESGFVTLPTPTLKDDLIGQYKYVFWSGRDSSNNWVCVPAGAPLDVNAFELGMVLSAGYRDVNNTQKLVFYSNNGVGSSSGLPIIYADNLTVQSHYGNTNSEGLVVDHWNTKPDGTGTRYYPYGTVSLDAGKDSIVLYAQWKPVLSYTTKTANEQLPQWSADIQSYCRDANGRWLTSLLAWRNADGTKLYTPGVACGLPAGTTLYAYCGNGNPNGQIWLDGNGAVEPYPVVASSTYSPRREDVAGEAYWLYAIMSRAGFVRDGYELIGWNTAADGSGTQYAFDHQFLFGEMHFDQNKGVMVETYDQDAIAAMPKTLYAQWKKLPDAKIIVPEDMQQAENAVLYAAIYKADGAFSGLIEIPAGADVAEVYDLEEGIRYQLFCLADDGTLQPLLRSEKGEF